MNASPTSIISMYQSGRTLAQIGSVIGVSAETIGRRIKSMGYKTRSRSEAASGARNSSWKGGRVQDNNGYWKVLVGRRKYQFEHRIVMERHLGRKLSKLEVVHHINQNPSDNRVENLKLVTVNTHRKEHVLTEWSRKYKHCTRCGDLSRAHASGELCTRCNAYINSERKRGYKIKYGADGRRLLSAEHRRNLSIATLNFNSRKKTL